MNKVVLIPDSFKGTMSSSEIIAIMKERILHYHPDCSVVSIPVADGGEGSVDSFLTALGGEKMYNTFGGNPIIFPFPSTSFVGRKPDLWRTPRGDVRPMRRHGYAWDGKFEVVEVCENALKMKFIPDADARQAYPYDYNMYVRYRFFQRSFISEIILQNIRVNHQYLQRQPHLRTSQTDTVRMIHCLIHVFNQLF